MKGNRGAKEIALSGICTAFAIIAATIAIFFEPLSISLNIIAGVFIMLPLTKNYWAGSIMSYVVSAIAAFFIGNINAIPYIAFFGIYPIIVCALDFKLLGVKKLPVWLCYVIGWIIKIAFYQLVIFIAWKFMNSVLIEMNFFGLEITYWLVTIVGNVLFLIFDIVMHFAYIYAKRFVDKRIR